MLSTRPGDIFEYMKQSHTFSVLALCAAILGLSISCVQISDPAAGSTVPTTHSTNFAPTDADAIAGTISLVVATESLSGEFAPDNIVVLWVEDDTGAFVKTLGVWAERRIGYLYSWKDSQGSSTVDGFTAATRSSHTGSLTVTWDGTNKAGTKMLKDTYLLRGEITDHNGAGKTFSVEINLSGGAVGSTTYPTVTGFQSIVASFTPTL